MQPTPDAAINSAFADHVIGPAWLTFLVRRHHMRTGILLGSFLALICSGCGTIANQEGDRKPYGGVVSIYRVGTFKDPPHGPPIGPIFLLDMPFSLVGDTLTLPFDAYYQHRVKEYQKSLKNDPP